MAAKRGAAARAQPNVFAATLARFKAASRTAEKRHGSRISDYSPGLPRASG